MEADALHVEAGAAREGRLCLDRPRHRKFRHMQRNYPRLNEFPERFTAGRDSVNAVEIAGRRAARRLGAVR